MKKIELFYEPLSIIDKINIKSEMTDSQLAFLCGALKYRKPTKVVEVGVAHGGTTCVVMQCLKELGNQVEFHSVDISEECYRAKGKRTGYAVDVAFEAIPSNIQHKWHLGKALPEYLDSIGKGIDFIILDTVHSMPGEMLDFLAVLPYLSEGAIVVLHDIVLNQYSISNFAYATRIVYDVAVADKIVADGVDPYRVLPNIGALEITKDTLKYIEKCFSSLVITWSYDLPDTMIASYREIYKRFYEDYLVDAFDKAVVINRNRMRRELGRKTTLPNFHKVISEPYKLIIFGGGDYAERIRSYLDYEGKIVDAYIVSDNVDIERCSIKQNIYHYSEMPFKPSECNLILGISEDKQSEVADMVLNAGFHQVYPNEEDDFRMLIKHIDKTNIIKTKTIKSINVQ